VSHVIPEKGAVGVSPDLTPIFPDLLRPLTWTGAFVFYP